MPKIEAYLYKNTKKIEKTALNYNVTRKTKAQLRGLTTY